MKNCLQCNSEFEPKNPKGKFCSDACKLKFNRAKSKGFGLGYDKDGKILKPPKPLTHSEIKEMHENSVIYNTPVIINEDDQKVGQLKQVEDYRLSKEPLILDDQFKYVFDKEKLALRREQIEVYEIIKPLLVELKMNAAEFVEHYRILQIGKLPSVGKKQINPTYVAKTNEKVINPEAPKSKQSVEPPVGSNAYFLKYGKWE